MENELVPIKNFNIHKKKTKNHLNSSKYNVKLHTLIYGRDINEELEPKEFHSQIKKGRGGKFNSIDNMRYSHKNKFAKQFNKEVSLSPRKSKKIPKKDNYITEYLEKLYEEEPHFKKSVFKKKTTFKNGFKNFNRKVSFLSPKDNKIKPNLNILKINKILNKTTNTNNNGNLDNNDSNSKIKMFKTDDFGDEQSYGYNKKYSVKLIDSKKTKNDDKFLRSSIFNNNEIFDFRNFKRKQTTKTFKSSNLTKFRHSEKKNTNKTNSVLNRTSKKKMSSKSNDRKLKKKINNNINHNINNCIDKKDKNDNNNNIEVNFNTNNDEKLKLDKNKQKKGINIVNKTEKNERKTEKKNDKKNENNHENNYKETKSKKKQDLSPNKCIENVETLVQIDQQNKKKRNHFCCNPFLICLKINSSDDNDNDNDNVL